MKQTKKELENQIERYKLALAECKTQRNEYLKKDASNWGVFGGSEVDNAIKALDTELDNILNEKDKNRLQSIG